MSHSISSAHKHAVTTGAGSTNGLGDLASRVSTKQPQANGSTSSFAQLMNQHADNQPKPAPSQPAKAPQHHHAAPKQSAPERPSAQMATAPARSVPVKQAAPQAPQQTANQSANASRADQNAANQRAQGRSAERARDDQTADKNGVDTKGKGESAQQAQAGASEEAQGGAAKAGAARRGAQPANGLQDQASLMAWLSQQPAQGQPAAGAQGGDQAMGAGQLQDGQAVQGMGMGFQQGQPGQPGANPVEMAADRMKAQAAFGANGQNGTALEGSGWKAAHGPAELQVDALLGKKGEDGAAGKKLEGADFSGAMAHAMRGAEASHAKPTQATEQATLRAPVHSPEFSQALTEQVSIWVNKAATEGPMQAELHLNPAELGPINVKISLDGQSAHVDFAAAALETRKAIEASLPMLSSALDSVGLSLTGGGVSDQTAQQQFAQNAGQSGGAGRSGRGGVGRGGDVSSDDHMTRRTVSAPRSSRLGGLDLYA